MNIQLHADEEDLAGELRGRYGDAVDLTVGFLRYPDRTSGHAGAAPRKVPSSRPRVLALPDENQCLGRGWPHGEVRPESQERAAD